MHELEEERDEIYGYDDGGDSDGYVDEEGGDKERLEEVDGEKSISFRCEDGEALLDGEEDPKDAGGDEEANCLPTTQGVDRPAEVDCHDYRD